MLKDTLAGSTKLTTRGRKFGEHGQEAGGIEHRQIAWLEANEEEIDEDERIINTAALAHGANRPGATADVRMRCGLLTRLRRGGVRVERRGKPFGNQREELCEQLIDALPEIEATTTAAM